MQYLCFERISARKVKAPLNNLAFILPFLGQIANVFFEKGLKHKIKSWQERGRLSGKGCSLSF
ncbi:hypothetical protein SC1083_2178 [Aggregatibacter actinomycetemcomitans serotype e str. SC1083]|uniref:Uncharacterized protein n=1 Tax=Aggregatibacter actinomycetemcomitans serotype e str. SC1083 TaxID=907488 RepID=G4ABE3_AGGAC|nr:hypothetical protein SC1083_2178 [Aggregatibacter actinomycetemcomitans serotype e str. SC1083]